MRLEGEKLTMKNDKLWNSKIRKTIRKRQSDSKGFFTQQQQAEGTNIHYGPEEKWISFPFGAMGYILRSRWEQPAHQQEPEA